MRLLQRTPHESHSRRLDKLWFKRRAEGVLCLLLSSIIVQCAKLNQCKPEHALCVHILYLLAFLFFDLYHLVVGEAVVET